MEFFNQDDRTALEAKEYVQSLAFGPIAFQASRALANLGILDLVENGRPQGVTLEDVAAGANLPVYGTRVLLAAGLGIGLLTVEQDRFHLTKAGYFLLHDAMTRVNVDFVNDICYAGMMGLEKSVLEGKPAGLTAFGAWPTIYEALSHLPETARASWLKFDHFYSDAAFPDALPIVFRSAPRRILDVGGNTGRWASQCVRYSKDVQVCIADLPGQLKMAEAELRKQEGNARITFFPINVLAPETEFPSGFDAIWMSQFLDCFSEDQIRSILGKCRKGMDAKSRLFILEPFWNRQRFRAGAFSLQMTSLYFTAMANGNSQIYESGLFLSLLKESGFLIEEQFDHLGVSHSLILCRPS